MYCCKRIRPDNDDEPLDKPLVSRGVLNYLHTFADAVYKNAPSLISDAKEYAHLVTELLAAG